MSQEHDNATGRDYQGFDLRSVSWGYRRVFAKAIEGLYEDGSIGPERRESTRVFFQMLKQSQPGSFDFAAKEFLGALNEKTKWILELPGIFEDLCRLGCQFAEGKLAHGIVFFRLWGQGGFGQTPEQVQDLLTHAGSLRLMDAELAQAFLCGYGKLIQHLRSCEVAIFVGELRRMIARNPQTAMEFAALRVKSAMEYVRALTQEARLEEMKGRLERLVRAVRGSGMRIEDLSQLNSDHLIVRNAHVVSFADAMYLPVCLRLAATRHENESLYLLTAVVAAACVNWRSFPAIHAEKGVSDVTTWLGGDEVAAALLTVVEMTRGVETLRREMPGLASTLDLALNLEFSLRPPESQTDALLAECLTREEKLETPNLKLEKRIVREVHRVASESRSCQETVEKIAPLREEFAKIADAPARALMFFPDFYYPASRGKQPPGRLIADPNRPQGRESPEQPPPAGEDRQEQPAKEERQPVAEVAYVYPEWNQAENDYYEDWCLLKEKTPAPGPSFRPVIDPQEQEARGRAKRMFERLKPVLARKEKFLEHGDEINVDRLVEFMAQRRGHSSPRVRFYEKTFIQKRDLAAAVLLDVSGSTAGPPGAKEEGVTPSSGQKRILDLEKHAAMTLGEGLEALGDPFGIYGFSGNGREQCEFFVYKNLEEGLTEEARRRLLAARPVASTRMGVALRHCLRKLQDHPARRKVILVITDGKPQDTGYDPATRYAQYDVRMACQECRRHDVHVVCISTLENTRSDLEIMFPHHRYVVLEDMRRLPDILPQLYLKMTT